MKRQEESRSLLLSKAIVASIFIGAALVGFILAPKEVYPAEHAYALASDMALKDESHLIFLDYKVYANEERFLSGLEKDVAKRYESFQSRHEIMLIKIHGSSSLSEKQDYWIKKDPSVPTLNIEYYIATTLVIEKTEAPCRSFIMLFDDTFSLINGVYIALLVFSFLGIESLAAIKLVRAIVSFRKQGSGSLPIFPAAE